MNKKIIDLEIIDDFEESGASKISLVDQPAINLDWVAFATEEFIYPEAGEDKDAFIGKCIAYNINEGKPEDQAAAICYRVWDEHSLSKEEFAESFSDYPEAASANAQRALNWAEENGWGSCGTPIGKIRANQLAKKEPISEETIARMASFERHRQNSDTPYGEGCGKLMWDAWGGDEGIAWAQRKLETIRTDMSIDVSALPVYIDETGKKKEKFESQEINIYGYRTRYFHMCPGATALFTSILSDNEDPETVGMVRAAAVVADKLFELEHNVIVSGKATYADMEEAIVLVEDFGDIMEEIGKIKGETYDVDFMIGHLEKIREYYSEKFAAVEDLKVGDAVSWKTADQNPRGRIREIVRNGGKTVPGTSFILQGTIDDPGYIIEIFEKKNGKWEPTGKYAGRKADSILKNVELWRQKFALEEDEQILVGPAMVPDMDILRRDKKTKETYYVKFSKDVIARIAEKFMRELRNQETNIEHEDNEAGAYVMESWIVESEDDKLNKVYGFNVPVGTWAVKMRVQDPETWDMVKKGKLNGFSIEGSFLTKEDYDAYNRDRQMYEKVMKILKSR